MVRTGDRCVRIGGGRSSSKKGGGGGGGSSTPKSKASSGPSKSNSSIGGNPVCPRETPNWQKPITNFFQKVPEESSINENEKQEKPENSKPQQSCSEQTDNEEDTSTVEIAGSSSEPQTEQVSLCSDSTPEKPSNDEMPSTSSKSEEEPKSLDNKPEESQSVCNTPTSERKRKSTINILTPKRIKS